VDTPESQFGEDANVAIVLHGILQQLSENRERSIQAGGYDKRRVIASIDSGSHQVFTVAGGLDQLLEADAVPGRQIYLSASGKAFAYNFSFGVEVATQGIPLCPYLIPRRGERYE
jgi:hypothetical protein